MTAASLVGPATILVAAGLLIPIAILFRYSLNDIGQYKQMIDAFTAARDAMPAGPDRDNLTSRLRRLNDRKENLEERQSRSWAVALLDI